MTYARGVAIGYVRVSTNGQAEGLGPELQAEAIAEWARAHIYHLAEVWRDEGVSGTLLDRPGLTEALGALGERDVLVVARLDRLARDLITQELLLRQIRKRGAELVSCADGEQAYLADDPNDPSRRLIRQVLGAVAEYERSMISLRLRMARAAVRRNGGYGGGEPPFGWRVAPEGGLEPDPREQEVLETMRWLREQRKTYRQMAEELNRNVESAQCGPRRGTRWTPSAVHRIYTRTYMRSTALRSRSGSSVQRQTF